MTKSLILSSKTSWPRSGEKETQSGTPSPARPDCRTERGERLGKDLKVAAPARSVPKQSSSPLSIKMTNLKPRDPGLDPEVYHTPLQGVCTLS